MKNDTGGRRAPASSSTRTEANGSASIDERLLIDYLSLQNRKLADHVVRDGDLTEIGLDILCGHLERGESIGALLIRAWESGSPVLLALAGACLANPEGAARLEALHCPWVRYGRLRAS